MCLDYRKVNKQLVTDIHSLPNLEELVEHVSGNQYYATLDLKDAYYQVMLGKDSRDITTSEGIDLYRFQRLHFGLSCSASIFVRQLQGALSPLLRRLDDVMLCAPSFDCLLQRLEQVFDHMEGVGIKLNLSKCHIGQQEVKFLGHVVSKEGFKPDPGNVEAIVKMEPPTNVKETRRFLGITGFYRKHMDRFSNIAPPLTNLTRKNQPFEWTEACQLAFEEIKTKLVSSPVLVKAIFSRTFVLETDARQQHVAAVLLQYDPNGLPQTIDYFSKKLKPAEVRYSTTDREALAIVLACRQFHHYLLGTKFIIRNDHQPIVSVFKQRTKSPRMKRWMLEMRDFRYKIEYKMGKKYRVADQLSRPVRLI